MPLDKVYTDLLASLTPQVNWDEKKTERFNALFDLLSETNARMNLTAVTGALGVTLKHFADSLSLLQLPELCEALDKGSVCDLGCGGGYPGLPLAIAFPETNLVMIDSTEKKLRSVAEHAQHLGLFCVRTVCGRGEELALPGSVYREAFDLVVSRAVAPLPILVELCLPFVRPGGIFVAMKGARSEEETDASRRGAGQLGSDKPEIVPVRYPEADLSALPEKERLETTEYYRSERALIVFRKIRSTPDRFPRSWANMKRKPL